MDWALLTGKLADPGDGIQDDTIGILPPMALAATVRGPDIILRDSIPLEATSDMPLTAPPVAIPTEASNSQSDQVAGVSKEITPEDKAVIDAVKIAPKDHDEKVEGKKVEAKTKDAADDDGPIDPALPGYANREIGRARQQARERVEAALKLAKAEIGDEAWEKALAATRDQVVEKTKTEAAKEVKAAKDAAAAELNAAKEAQAALEARIAEFEAAKPKEEPKADPRPGRDQFDDPDAYDEAMVEWGKREGVRAAEGAAAEARAKAAEEARVADEAKTREAHEAEIATWNAKWTNARTEAIEKYPDYVAVAEADNVKITGEMAAAILQSDNGTDVAYYLGQNPDEAERIAGLTMARQMLEIGKLSERLEAPAPRRRRSAQDAPIEPIDTSVNTADTSEAEPTMEQIAARHAEKAAAKHRPFFPQGGIH